MARNIYNLLRMNTPITRAVVRLIVLSFSFSLGLPSCADDLVVIIEPVKSGIPRTSHSRISGKVFIQKILKKSPGERERLIYKFASEGNIPSFLRHLKKVNVRTKLKNGSWLSGAIYVMKDYLAVGDDQDYIRIPMTPMTAQKIADRWGYTLPTTKMVDDIYRQAGLKLSPRPLPPGRQMTSVSYFSRHNKKINKQIHIGKNHPLIAGHKKDIVITNRLLRKPRKVAIYGWHRKSGKPIQPLSLVHNDRYADYSHGVRLIWNMMEVGGKRYEVKKVLQDKAWSKLISDEGVMKNVRLNTTGRLADVPAKESWFLRVLKKIAYREVD